LCFIQKISDEPKQKNPTLMHRCWDENNNDIIGLQQSMITTKHHSGVIPKATEAQNISSLFSHVVQILQTIDLAVLITANASKQDLQSTGCRWFVVQNVQHASYA
jgi:hypothetical protein